MTPFGIQPGEGHQSHSWLTVLRNRSETKEDHQVLQGQPRPTWDKPGLNRAQAKGRSADWQSQDQLTSSNESFVPDACNSKYASQ